MISNKARLFVALPMNPLHRYQNEDSTLFETDLKTSNKTYSPIPKITLLHNSESTTSSSGLLHIPSSYSRTRNIHPSPNSTSDFTVIEIIKPDKQNHDSDHFIPAFAKPYMPIQDLSLESATLMNLRPLKTSLSVVTGSGGLQTRPPSALVSSPSFQSIPHYHLSSASSAILSSSHGKVKVGSSHYMIHQQSSEMHQSQSTQQSPVDSLSRTQSSPFPPLPISKSLTKVKVVYWVNELRRYHFLWKTSRMNSAHAAELHQLLCKIEDKMAHPFLTPQVLGETRLGRVMKLFQHGDFDTRSKEVVHRVIQYWRKLCLEA